MKFHIGRKLIPMDMNNPQYSIVVPVFKSEQTLPELYERIVRTFKIISAAFELILVEDGGGDNSWQVMQRLRQEDKRVRIICLAGNFGQHAALMCGLAFARGDYVITIDDDLQNPPEEIPRLIDAMRHSNDDVAFGIPKRKSQTYMRRVGGYLFGRITAKMFGHIFNLKVSNVMIAKKRIVEQILGGVAPRPIVPFLALGATDCVGTVFIEHCPRRQGRTSYSWKKLMRLFMDGILYYNSSTFRGLQAVSTGCFLVSVLMGIIWVILYLDGKAKGGCLAFVLPLFFIAVILSIIRKHLIRVIQETPQKPQYVIREKDV
jgi:polyisoprenyl-phosphate glycosyltransferase